MWVRRGCIGADSQRCFRFSFAQRSLSCRPTYNDPAPALLQNNLFTSSLPPEWQAMSLLEEITISDNYDLNG